MPNGNYLVDMEEQDCGCELICEFCHDGRLSTIKEVADVWHQAGDMNRRYEDLEVVMFGGSVVCPVCEGTGRSEL